MGHTTHFFYYSQLTQYKKNTRKLIFVCPFSTGVVEFLLANIADILLSNVIYTPLYIHIHSYTYSTWEITQNGRNGGRKKKNIYRKVLGAGDTKNGALHFATGPPKQKKNGGPSVVSGRAYKDVGRRKYFFW
eukprot:GEMP01096830.1.p1 GENE.GEMP01096830.1~~GEMP01096830.1.p1  ORF type:complete len:132 (-),score=2.56 GEMP01096830.1:39-434(-)